jgi:hypothetical protein
VGGFTTKAIHCCAMITTFLILQSGNKFHFSVLKKPSTFVDGFPCSGDWINSLAKLGRWALGVARQEKPEVFAHFFFIFPSLAQTRLASTWYKKTSYLRIWFSL